MSPSPAPTSTVYFVGDGSWGAGDVIALVAVLAAVFIAWWGQQHDRKMRKLEFEESKSLREEDRKEARDLRESERQEDLRRREEERADEWVVRTQQLCADTRTALLDELSVPNLTEGLDDPIPVIRRVVDFDLRGRFSLLGNFAEPKELRDAATKASNALHIYLNRAGAASKKNKHHADYADRFDRAHRKYGEAHYALDELVHVAGGPEPISRDSYHWALDSDP